MPKEQILSFKSRPQFGRALSSVEANRKSQKLFYLDKRAEKCGGVLIHLSLAANRIRQLSKEGLWLFPLFPVLVREINK